MVSLLPLRLPLSIALLTLAAGPALGDLDDARDRDAAAGRAYIGPTALTLRGGHVSASGRAPVWPAAYGGISVGLIDRVEVGVGGGWILAPSGHASGAVVKSAYAKVQVWRRARTAVAVDATAFWAAYSDGLTPDQENTSGAAGVIATTCNERCDLQLNGHLHFHTRLAGDPDVLSTGAYGGTSLLAGQGRARFVLEVAMGIDGVDTTFLAYSGVRVTGRHMSLDAGMGMRAADNDAQPWPVLGLSGRL